MIKKLKKFITYDIRTKLTKFNLYPNYFYKTGIKSIYSKLVFFLMFREKIKIIQKINYQKIFCDYNENAEVKKNYLVSAPSSGSTFARNMFRSYFEIINKVGNGIPKYDSINNQYMFSASPIVHDDMYNSIITQKPINIPEGLYNNNRDFLTEEQFQKTQIIWGRHPINNADLFIVEDLKPLILLRHPIEQIISVYMKYDNREEELKKSIDQKILTEKIRQYKKFIFYWNDYITKKSKKDFLVIDYEKLTNQTEEVFEKMLIFFNYDVNYKILKKTIAIHSRKNTEKWFKGITIRKKLRFTNINKKNEQKEILKEYLTKELKEQGILDIYNKIEK
jgi:hypothetical protein